jgi:hypothetical protein
MGRPIQEKDDRDEPWVCPFQVIGMGKSQLEYAFGIDAFQAIQLAFVWFEGVLPHMARELGGHLEFLEEDDIGFGLILRRAELTRRRNALPPPAPESSE